MSQVAQRVAARYLRGFLRIAKGDGELGPFYEWAKNKYPEVRNPKKDGRKDQITFDTLKGYAGGGDVGAKQVLRRMHQEWAKDYGDEEGGESVDNVKKRGPLQEAEWLQGLADKGVKVKGWQYDEDDITGEGWWYQEKGETLPVKTILENTSRHSKNLAELREKYEGLKGKLPPESWEQRDTRFERVKREEKEDVDRKEKGDKWERVRPKPENYQVSGWPKVHPDTGGWYKVPGSSGDEGYKEEFSKGVSEAMRQRTGDRFEKVQGRLSTSASKKDESGRVPKPQSYSEAVERSLLWNKGAGLRMLDWEMYDEMDSKTHRTLWSAVAGVAWRGVKEKFPVFKTERERRTQARGKVNRMLGRELEKSFSAMGVPGHRGGKPSGGRLERGLQEAAVYYADYFARAGIETLPVVFADGEKDGTREALRFGGNEHPRFGDDDVPVPDELVAKKGEYIEDVPVGELLPMLLIQGRRKTPVKMPAREKALAVPKKKKPGWKKRFKKMLDKKGGDLENRVAARWLESRTVVG